MQLKFISHEPLLVEISLGVRNRFVDPMPLDIVPRRGEGVDDWEKIELEFIECFAASARHEDTVFKMINPRRVVLFITLHNDFLNDVRLPQAAEEFKKGPLLYQRTGFADGVRKDWYILKVRGWSMIPADFAYRPKTSKGSV